MLNKFVYEVDEMPLEEYINWLAWSRIREQERGS